MTIRTLVRTALLLGAGYGLAAGNLAAQALPPGGDVEMLGRTHGTTPPRAYYEQLARDPDAFSFERAWKARNPQLRRVGADIPGQRPRFEVVGAAGAAGGGGASGISAIGPRDGPVTGTIRVPVLLGLFSDSPGPPWSQSELQAHLFDGPSEHYKTIREFYDEISGGALDLVGETMDWQQSGHSQAEVTAGVSALSSASEIGGFILDLLSQQSGVDWGLYDNDGLDGVPNSGDDDGYVDILAVIHPTHGAECGGLGQDFRIWSHKWALSSAAGQVYVTSTPSANGGNIRVNDYTVQPAYACDGTEIAEIGVLAHELGHGLGLPDLYAVSASHAGIGGWGLMGSGSYGCSQGAAERPCHMMAWSKEQLGWVDVVDLAPGADLGTLTFEPIETTGKVYRIDAQDGSGDYYLLENRQRIGFDENLFVPGLLVWRIDVGRLQQTWYVGDNRVNSMATRMGVYLQQADGLDQLATSGQRGDAGDPYPGSSMNAGFHAGSTPSARTHLGGISGLTLTDIALAGQEVTARVLTRFQDVTLQATLEGEANSTIGFVVDGVDVGASPATFTSAPLQSHIVEAGGGAALEDGLRAGFTGWTDDGSAPRTRTIQTPTTDRTLTADYGDAQARIRLTKVSGQIGVSPGEVVITPAPSDEPDGLWVAVGQVSFEAQAATGFAFDGWSQGLAGQPNPATLELDGPLDVTASFDVIYDVPDATHPFQAATPQSIQLTAENANPPVTWSLVSGPMPPGMVLQSTGLINGAALETGEYTLTLRGEDAVGLAAEGTLVLQISEPDLGLDALVGSFLGTGADLTLEERRYVDRQGNEDLQYDLGDFRAYLLAHPNLPATAGQRAPADAVIPLIDLGGGGDR